MPASDYKTILWATDGIKSAAVVNALVRYEGIDCERNGSLADFCSRDSSEGKRKGGAEPQPGTVLFPQEVSSSAFSDPIPFDLLSRFRHVFIVGNADSAISARSAADYPILFALYCELYQRIGADRLLVLDIGNGRDDVASCLNLVLEFLEFDRRGHPAPDQETETVAGRRGGSGAEDLAASHPAASDDPGAERFDGPDYHSFFRQQALIRSMRNGAESLLCLQESENAVARIVFRSDISSGLLPHLLVTSSMPDSIGVWVVDHAIASAAEIDASVFDLPIVLCADQFHRGPSKLWQEIVRKYCVIHCFGQGTGDRSPAFPNLSFTTIASGRNAAMSARLLERDIAASLEKARAESRSSFIRENPREDAVPRDWYDAYNRNLAENPDRICLSDGVRSFTTARLNREAVALADIISDLTPRSLNWIAIFIERSALTVVAMASALRLGRPFLEIPSWYSREHVEVLVTKVGADVIVTSAGLADRLEGLRARTVICDGELASATSRSPALPWAPPPGIPEHIGLGLLTSGTTGVGKVAAIATRKLLAFHDDVWAKYIRPGDRLGLNAWLPGYIFHPIFCNATGVVIPDDVVRNPFEFTRFVRDENLNQIVTTPTMLESILSADIPHVARELSSLHTIWISGEKPSRGLAPLIRDTLGTKITILDYYGSNEAGDVAIAPFGEALKLVGSAHCQIVDDDGHHVPKGAVGNLYLSTPGLFSGYASDEAETANSFVPNPLEGCHDGFGGQLYKTGDMARPLGERRIEITGRSKHQTKLRGFKVVFKNVEDVIAGHPQVAQSIVAVDGEGKSRRLISIIVPRDKDRLPHGRDLRNWAKSRLPYHSVPSAYFHTEKIPYGFTQKRDDRLLPALDELHRLPDDESSKTAVEAEVAKAWRAVLGDNLPELSQDDDFYEFGGSLAVVELVSQLNDRFGVNITLSDLTADTTLRGISDLVSGRRHGPARQGSMTDIQAEVDAFPVNAGKAAPQDLLADYRGKPGKRVLLTGATGYLGSALLVALAEAADVSEVICLIRRKEQSASLHRLLDDPAMAGKITPIQGSLSDDLLGLSGETYLDLAHRVDAVVHAAAEVNWIKSYSSLKETNVNGTWRVLNCALAASAPVVFLSTLSGEAPSTGYNETKLVAEGLCRKVAQNTGLPVSVLRCGDIAAPSPTHRPYSLNENDYVVITLKACLRMGVWPDCPNWSVNLAPVDYVADAISHIAVAAPAGGFQGIIGLLNPSGNTGWQEMFAWIAARGEKHPVQPVPLSVWLEKVDEFAARDPLVKKLKILLPYIIDDFENPPDPMASFHPPPLAAPTIDERWLDKVLEELLLPPA